MVCELVLSTKKMKTSFNLPFWGSSLLQSIKIVSLLGFLVLSGNASSVLAQSLTDPALNFTIFVKDNVTLKNTEVEGRVAVGGNLILANTTYQIIPKTDDGFKFGGIPIGLAVRGGVQLGSGALKIDGGNYVKIGNPNSPQQLQANYVESAFWVRKAGGSGGEIFINHSLAAMGVSESVNPIFENVFGTEPGKIDIDRAFDQFLSTSNALGSLEHNVVMKDFDNASVHLSGPFRSKNGLPGKPKFILDPNKLNVLTITNEVWSSFNNEVRFEGFQSIPKPGFGLIINIENASGDVRFASLPDLVNNKGYTVINFPGATSDIKLKGNGQLDGVILAPKAKVKKDSFANFVGQVIAREFEHDGDEIHFHPLKIQWVQPVVEVSGTTRCYLGAPYLDYEVTTNFDVSNSKATIDWIDPDGKKVKRLENQPLRGSLLFPGAAVNDQGDGVAWPGWKFVDGQWVEFEDENAKLLLAGSKIKVWVGDSYSEFVYPQSSGSCFTDPTPPDGSLPVRMVAFGVAPAEQTGSALLTWEVDDAVNFSHFEVEKSSSGAAFTQIGRVDFSERTMRYSFVDSQLSAGLTYYRLRLVDLDGSSEYSRIESLVGTSGAPAVYGYPNPFSDKLTIVSGSRQTARVYNTIGREIARVQLTEGVNEIDASGWPVGLSLIKTDDAATLKVIRK